MQEDITLTLPPGTKVSDLKWISVWCRAFQVNFGDLIFPAGFKLEAGADAESEPEGGDDIDAHHPPLVHPTGNAHDPHHRHDHDHDDPDAEHGYAEGEAESEAEAEAEAAYAGAPAGAGTPFGAFLATALLAAFLW